MHRGAPLITPRLDITAKRPEGCWLTARLVHYELPMITTEEDTDWVSSEVAMTVGTEGAF
jgi:hypothetical protein